MTKPSITDSTPLVKFYAIALSGEGADLKACVVECYLASVVDTYCAKLEALPDALASANDMCRSMASIAEREGADTAWAPFQARLMASLEMQHKAMYTETNFDSEED